jgi:hypothetical protein
MACLTVFCCECERLMEAMRRGDEFRYAAMCPDCGAETHLVVLQGPLRVRRVEDSWYVSHLTEEEAESASRRGVPSSHDLSEELGTDPEPR